DQHPGDGDQVRAAAPYGLAEKPRDQGAGQRREGYQQVEVLHVRHRQPLRLSRSSTLIVARLRNSTTRIARPIADSAAATVRMKNTNTWPPGSPSQRENARQLVLPASSISSSAISRVMTFLRLRKMPATAMQNSTAPRVRKCASVIMACSTPASRRASPPPS